MYAVKTGDYQGGFFIWIRERDLEGNRAFLFIPNPMEAIYVSDQDITNEFKNKKLDFIRCLPEDVYEVCRANWKYYYEKSSVSEYKKPNN